MKRISGAVVALGLVALCVAIVRSDSTMEIVRNGMLGLMFIGWVVYALSPLALVVLVPGSSRLRVALCVIAGYCLVAVLAGGFAYLLVPAEYTRGLRWNWPPASSPLGESHAVYLDRVANSPSTATEDGARIRQMVHEERVTFLRRWLMLALPGLAITVAGLLLYNRWSGPRPGRGAAAGRLASPPPRARPSRDAPRGNAKFLVH